MSVQSRIEYFGRDLHAADALYHHTCAINFRTGKGVPVNYSDPPPNKRKKPGHPKDSDHEQAFERIFFEENDEEGFTISQLSEKMKGYLQDQTSISYGNSYLKSQLLKRYGDSVYIANSDGLHDIITFRETTTNILCEYFNRPNKDDEEVHKRAIIAAAVKFIKSDIKANGKSTMDEYPQTDKLSLESSLEYLPPSLRFMLQHLLVGKDTHQKQASIGQAIIQGTRPRTVLAPLQIGLAVQMHHHFRSRFLIDNLFALGSC